MVPPGLSALRRLCSPLTRIFSAAQPVASCSAGAALCDGKTSFERFRAIFSSVASPDRTRRLVIGLVVLLALAPVLSLFARTSDARRNFVYWDEFDTALSLILRLHEDPGPRVFLREMFAISNEHRMVTSRLLYAASYELTGTVNFAFISFVGNATLVALCVLLVITAGTTGRRLLMAVLLAAFLFQLQHYENFMWSGASIDHFQVVLLAAGAIVAVVRDTRAGLFTGAALATLATFTLAHGILTWAVGAAILWRASNRRGLAIWCGLATIAIAGFLIGFQFNRAHAFASVSSEGAWLVFNYWLTLLGAVPAMGGNALAPWCGAALLATLGWLTWRGAARQEPIAYALMLYAVAALALIALGRAQHSGGVVYSRYYVLAAVAWAMAVFIALQRASTPERPFRPTLWMLPVLAVFNLGANHVFSRDAGGWVECRDRAVVSYIRHGVDGRGPLTLHPSPEHATALLEKAERAGVYRMPPVCIERPFTKDVRPSSRIAYFVDEMTVDRRAAAVVGWAALPGERSRRGELHVLLRSARRHICSPP